MMCVMCCNKTGANCNRNDLYLQCTRRVRVMLLRTDAPPSRARPERTAELQEAGECGRRRAPARPAGDGIDDAGAQPPCRTLVNRIVNRYVKRSEGWVYLLEMPEASNLAGTAGQEFKFFAGQVSPRAARKELAGGPSRTGRTNGIAAYGVLSVARERREWLDPSAAFCELHDSRLATFSACAPLALCNAERARRGFGYCLK